MENIFLERRGEEKIREKISSHYGNKHFKWEQKKRCHIEELFLENSRELLERHRNKKLSTNKSHQK